MANITGVGAGTLPDDVAEGTALVVDTTQITSICFYISTTEEVIAFLGEDPNAPVVPPPPPEEEEDPEVEPAPLPTSTLYEVLENAGQVTMTFVRSNPRPGKSVQFGITALAGTALLNQNYLNPATPVIFPSDETVSLRNVSIVNSHMGTGVSKSLTVRISPAASRWQYIRGPIHEATIKILGVP